MGAKAVFGPKRRDGILIHKAGGCGHEVGIDPPWCPDEVLDFVKLAVNRYPWADGERRIGVANCLWKNRRIDET